MLWAAVLVCALFATAGASVPLVDARDLTFEDVDTRTGFLSGIAVIKRALVETSITHYAIYFSAATAAGHFGIPLLQPLGYEYPAVVDNIALPSLANPAHPAGFINVLIPPTKRPDDAASLIVVSLNNNDRKSNTSVVLPIQDTTQPPTRFCKQSTTLNFPSAAFDDGSGSSNYVAALQQAYTCRWTITNPKVDKFLFRVTALDLDSSHLDTLCVYNGGGVRDQTTELHCFDQAKGPTTTFNIVSLSNTIQVEFSVKSSVTGDGFRAVYYGLTNSVVQNAEEGSVFEVQYDQDIPVNCHCTDVSCQGQPSNCIVDEGNGKGFATCKNLGTCRP